MPRPTDTERDQCLDAETLAAYVDGLLAHDAVQRADRHIDSCRVCRGELSALAATTSFPAGSASPPIPDVDAVPPAPETLGRYQVEREIGRGNMGVVVRAYDPELARAVAVKILAPKWAHGSDARERLRREAQAMARLSHPNVVQVYDVTTEGELLAIAMELVEGSTLRTAITNGTPWRTLLAICIAAGRGLAAAHAAKLIHRDFKPENVLVARAEASEPSEPGNLRVLVSDFGLARVDDVPALEATASPTRTTLAGTPAYIAPELLRGEPATVASDQFSYCVATYEALYGERPFAGASLDELRARMASGEIADVQGSPIPPRIRAALLRGLSPDPARRFASMEALLDALDEPSRRIPRLALAGAGIAIAGVLALVVLRGSEPSCEIDDTAIAWDRDGVSRALAASLDGPQVIASIERYQREWIGARRKACEATRVRKELSERVLDARNACLDRGRRELVELAALLVRDPTLSARGVEAVGRLQDPQACTPDVGEVRGDAEVDRAFALLAAGRAQDAVDVAAKVLARPTLAPVIRAQALLARGRGEGQLEHHDIADKLLNEAIPLAEEARAINVVATIWVELVSLTGAQNHKFDAAQAYMRGAEAAFRRADPGPALRAHYEYVVGAMLLARGSLDEAKTYFERSLVALGAAYPGDRGAVHGALCDLYRQKRELAQAREQCARAEALLVETFGPDHQKLAITYNTWGTVELADKQRAAARAKWARTIAILEKRGLEHDRSYALAFSNTGVTYSEEGELDKARPLFERARDLFAKYHPKHVQRTLPLQGLAGVALRQKDYRAAIAAYEEALGVIETVYGKEDERRITVLYNLTLAYQRLPDLAKARAITEEIVRLCEHPGKENWRMLAYALDLQAVLIEQETKDWARAIETRKHALDALDKQDDPAQRAWITLEIGRVMRNSGKLVDSIAYLEKARAFYIQPNAMPDRYEAGTSQFWLAKSLWETGRDRRRAVALAKAALAELEATKAGLNIETHRAQVTAWLAKHR